MKLDNFRELLLKKSADPSLEGLIKFVREDVLLDIVIDSLEKMADNKNTGKNANVAMHNFGMDMDPELEPKMIHDALSHHASRYKAALKANRQDLANDHMSQVFKIFNMARRAEKHSRGKLDVDAVSPHAWERNAKKKQYEEDHPKVQEGKRAVGDFVNDTKGWRYKGSDFSWLKNAPHESYSKEIRTHGHAGAYPLEQMRVNGKFLHIEDIDHNELAGYKEHEFDKHPIIEHDRIPTHQHSSDTHANYMSGVESYHEGPHVEGWFNRHDQMNQSDPDSYSKRGLNPSDAVHAEVKPLDYENVVSSPNKSIAKPKKPSEASLLSSEDIDAGLASARDRLANIRKRPSKK